MRLTGTSIRLHSSAALAPSTPRARPGSRKALCPNEWLRSSCRPSSNWRSTISTLAGWCRSDRKPAPGSQSRPTSTAIPGSSPKLPSAAVAAHPLPRRAGRWANSRPPVCLCFQGAGFGREPHDDRQAARAQRHRNDGAVRPPGARIDLRGSGAHCRQHCGRHSVETPRGFQRALPDKTVFVLPYSRARRSRLTVSGAAANLLPSAPCTRPTPSRRISSSVSVKLSHPPSIGTLRGLAAANERAPCKDRQRAQGLGDASRYCTQAAQRGDHIVDIILPSTDTPLLPSHPAFPLPLC